MAIFKRVDEHGRVIEQIDAGEHPHENARLQRETSSGDRGWRLVSSAPEPEPAPVVAEPTEPEDPSPPAPEPSPEPAPEQAAEPAEPESSEDDGPIARTRKPRGTKES